MPTIHRHAATSGECGRLKLAIRRLQILHVEGLDLHLEALSGREVLGLLHDAQIFEIDIDLIRQGNGTVRRDAERKGKLVRRLGAGQLETGAHDGYGRLHCVGSLMYSVEAHSADGTLNLLAAPSLCRRFKV